MCEALMVIFDRPQSYVLSAVFLQYIPVCYYMFLLYVLVCYYFDFTHY